MQVIDKMAIENPIVNLSDILGGILYSFIQFFGSIMSGYTLILAVITVGFVTIIYFRFLRNVTAEAIK